MNYQPGFPKHMVHPQHAPATMLTDARGDTFGTAMRYPPQMADTPEAEEDLRARGYLQSGEAVKTMTDYHEYPLMLTHPNHQPEIPDRIDAQMVNGTIQTFVIAGKREILPPVTVNSKAEEEAWNAKGYLRPGSADAKAFDRAKTAPGEPGEEWPKYVDGVLMQDPDTPAPPTNEFPKWVNLPNGQKVIVNSLAEEEGLIGPRAKPVDHGPSGDEWAEFQAWKASQEAKTDDLSALRERATELQIAFDKRWGAKRLRDAIAEAGEAA